MTTKKQTTRIDQFIKYLKVEKQFSAYTLRCYQGDLRQFARFLMPEETTKKSSDNPPTPGKNKREKKFPPENLNRLLTSADNMTIRSFLTAIDEHHYSQATTARKIAALRSFYKWMLKRSYKIGRASCREREGITGGG